MKDLTLDTVVLHKTLENSGEAWVNLNRVRAQVERRIQWGRACDAMERLTVYGMIGVVCFMLGVSVVHAERRDSDNRSNGERPGGGGDYGHSTDYCGSECGNGTSYLRDGRDGPAYSGNTWHGPRGQGDCAGF